MNTKERIYWFVGKYSRRFRLWYYRRNKGYTLWGIIETMKDQATLNTHEPPDLEKIKEVYSVAFDFDNFSQIKQK